LAEERPIPQPDKQLIELATRLRNVSLDRELAMLSQTLAQPNLDPEETNAVLREVNALRAAKRGPLTPLPSSEAAEVIP
jgi:hypothetical protein